MLNSELFAQVRRLEIRTRRVVDELLGGAYHSRFKGRGMEFDEVREYVYGDDVRDIDWNVTARMNQPFIKKYVEERELHVMVAVDLSASMNQGSTAKNKRRVGTELAAILALSAIRNQDKVGLLTFSDHIESHVPPKGGMRHVLRMIRDVMAYTPASVQTDLSVPLRHMRRTLRKRAVIFILTDALQDSAQYALDLQLLCRRHDVVLIQISDPAETRFPLSGEWCLADAERGTRFTWHNTFFQADAQMEAALKRETELKQLCARSKCGFVSVKTDGDLVEPLRRYFEQTRQGRARQ